MQIPQSEQETTINIDRNGTFAEIYTSDTTKMTKLDKLVEANPNEWKLVRTETCDGDLVAKCYQCPKGYIRFAGKKREYTEEQRAAMAERLRSIKST